MMELGTEAATNDDAYHQREAWPLAIALAIAALLSFMAGWKLARVAERRLVDPATDEEVVISTANHSLFFVPMIWRGPILLVVAVVVFVQRLVAQGGA